MLRVFRALQPSLALLLFASMLAIGTPLFAQPVNPHAREASPEVLLLLAPGARADLLMAGLPVERWHQVGDLHNWVRVVTASPSEAEQLATSLAGNPAVLSAIPQRKLVFGSRLPDPYYTSQYWLNNTGQGGGAIGTDINVEDAWTLGFTGTGVRVLLLDDGVDYTHPDLLPGIEQGLSTDLLDSDSNPTPEFSYENHGTAMAGLIMARRENGLGIAGVAPNASLIAVRGTAVATSDALLASGLGYQLQRADVYVSGWGPADTGDYFDAMLVPGTLSALQRGVEQGRKGLGSIYLWAAGNGKLAGDSSSYDGIANLPETITVTLADHLGRSVSFAEGGPNVMFCVPITGLSVTTTDRQGANGYNDGSEGIPTEYTARFGGTSAAAAVAGGVVAQLLHAAPKLTWRDVQHMLIRTATRTTPNDPGWKTNGAGLHFHPDFGFGMLDSSAVIQHRGNWTLVGHRVSHSAADVTSGVLPDNSSLGVGRGLTINRRIYVEHVQVTVDIAHPDWGQLRIELESPDGTVSVLAEPHTGAGPNSGTFTFGTVQCWGEESQGTWQLRVYDVVQGFQGTFNGWQLIIHGTENAFNAFGGVPPSLDQGNPEVFVRNEPALIRGANLAGAKVFLGAAQQEVLSSSEGAIEFQINEGMPLARYTLRVETISGSDSGEVVVTLPSNTNFNGDTHCTIAQQTTAPLRWWLPLLFLALFAIRAARRTARNAAALRSTRS